MIVYVALKDDNSSSKILGVFSSKDSAANCCLKQSTYTYQPWQKDDADCWENGHGLYVRVVEYNVL